MTLQSLATNIGPIQLRPYRAEDGSLTAGLLTHGRPLVGAVPPDAITLKVAETEYFAHPPNHLWIAEADGLVIGLAGLKHEQPMVARLAMLCIDDDWDDTDVTERLLHAVLRHCHHFGYLKLVAETAWPPEEVINLFARCGLRYTRHRGELDESTCLLEFYVDLYRHGGHASIDAAVAPEDHPVAAH